MTELTIAPEEMPEFLNELAMNRFAEEPEIYWKLAQCSLYLKFVVKEDCDE